MSNRLNKVRVLSHEDQKVLKILNTEIKQVDNELAPINYALQEIDAHILDRIKDRDICLADASLVLKFLLKNKLCQLIYNCQLSDNTLQKFTIQYDKEFFILCTVRIVRGDLRLIKFNSIIPYNTYQIHEGFVIKINRLVKK